MQSSSPIVVGELNFSALRKASARSFAILLHLHL
jgi:hypothetical protein